MNFTRLHTTLSSTLRRDFSSSRSILARQTTHYEELGVGRGASRKEIQAKFYELSKIYHPDAPSTSSSGSMESRTSKFQAISQSYSILSDDSSRKIYDQTIHGSYGRRPGYTSGAGHEAGSRSGFGGGSSYSSGENSARRERANYAWSHPRRTSASNPTAGSGEAQGRAEPVRNRPGNGPTTASEDLFSRFAAREVRSRARAAASNRHHTTSQHFGTTSSGTEAFGEKAEEESRLINESGVKRSGTVILLFGGTFATAVLFSEGKKQTRY